MDTWSSWWCRVKCKADIEDFQRKIKKKKKIKKNSLFTANECLCKYLRKAFNRFEKKEEKKTNEENLD